MSSKVELIGQVSGDALDQIATVLANRDLQSRTDDPFQKSLVAVSSYFDVAVAARENTALVFNPKFIGSVRETGF